MVVTMKFYFILFISSFLTISNIFAAPSQAVLSGIDVAVLKAMRDIRKGVSQKDFSGIVAVGQVHLKGDQMVNGEVEYFSERMEALLSDIKSQVSIRFSNDAFKGLNDTPNQTKLQTAAEKLNADYVAYITIEKEEASFSLSMTVFETASLKQVWSKGWKASIIAAEDEFVEASVKTTIEREEEEEDYSPPENRLTFDISLDIAIDNQYFFGITSIIGGDLSSIALIGLRYGALFSYNSGNIPLTRNFAGVGKVTTHTMGIPLTLDFYFSLINSSRRDYTFFDLELYIKGGVLLGLSSERATLTTLTSTIIYQTPYTFFWKPLFSFGFNFLFIERVFFYFGSDLGSFISVLSPSSFGAITKTPARFFVAPTFGVGYRF